jgi:hypothetical protein
MGIDEFDFEGIGMIAERGIDGGRERVMKSCDGTAMACRSIGRAVHSARCHGR